MQITWASQNIKLREDRFFSSAASVRYRLILPAQALLALGHRVEFLQIGLDSRLEEVLKGLSGEVLVISKLAPSVDAFERMAELMLQLIRAAREKGLLVAADISDHHFDHPTRGAYFKEAVKECDVIVAATSSMADIVRRHTVRPVYVVSDPYEGVQQRPRFNPPSPFMSGLLPGLLRSIFSGVRLRRPLRLLWFGHESNFESLAALLPDLRRLTKRYSVELLVVTTPKPEIVSLCERFNIENAPAFRLRFIPWSMEATWAALKEGDIVVIPSLRGDSTKAVKSPNRVIESLWAGRFVCANPVHSYQEFAPFTWIGEDIVSGIEWAVQNRREVMRKLKAGQGYIARNCSPEAIARQWESALTNVGETGAIQREDKPVKLNLGCGGKILPGYINVDIEDSRGDVSPDVLCDLHRLSPFLDGTADEVLSVHVVEHFWRWEAADVLKEWMRVLKPGGEMILECPNLITACEEFLRDPDTASGPGKEGQRTMWVFYGDPRWHDPLMVHRWGYTPHSLARLMSEVGLVNVRQEPAQFKLGDPRDMRVVGQKPL